jgi:hypothetical protein
MCFAAVVCCQDKNPVKILVSIPESRGSRLPVACWEEIQ